MNARRMLRFSMILGGMMASIAVAAWPALRDARRSARRAGIT